METLIGILVDVSKSMKRSVGNGEHDENREWVRSIFNVIHDLIKQDASPGNYVFVLGFGAKEEPDIFDLLNTLQKYQKLRGKTHRETLESLLNILEKHGAPRVRKWASMGLLMRVVEESDAKTFLERLDCNDVFCQKFVNECLPESCRRIPRSFSIASEAGYHTVMGTLQATDRLVTTARNVLRRPIMVSITRLAIRKTHENTTRAEDQSDERTTRDEVSIYCTMICCGRQRLQITEMYKNGHLDKTEIHNLGPLQFRGQASSAHMQLIAPFDIGSSLFGPSIDLSKAYNLLVTNYPIISIVLLSEKDAVSDPKTADSVQKLVSCLKQNVSSVSSSKDAEEANRNIVDRVQQLLPNLKNKSFVSLSEEPKAKVANLEMNKFYKRSGGHVANRPFIESHDTLNYVSHKNIMDSVQQLLSELEQTISFVDLSEYAVVDRQIPHTILHNVLRKEGLIKEDIRWQQFIGEVPLQFRETSDMGNKFHETATEESLRKTVDRGKQLLSKSKPKKSFVSISEDAVVDVHKAQEILHGCERKEDLTKERIDELMDIVRPHIYYSTPLMTTLRSARDLFAMSKVSGHRKLLFILSDGEPTDCNDPPLQELSDLGVTTVCCFIAADRIDDPRHLYSTEQMPWDKAAKRMFAMSSSIETQTIPRTIFVKRGWKIDIENNITRLFVQVNHPDIIEEACDLARDIVCSQDALSDLLSSVTLDLYINQANEGFEPQQQRGGTCYANASAAVLHLAMQRIVRRDGGYPNFVQLRDEMIGKYGEDGANTLRVLQEVCPSYRLHCKEVNVTDALKAITAKRPVLARFRLTGAEWKKFSDFYKKSPRGILSISELQIQRPTGASLGHAVVLTSFDSQGLRLMNSWGDTWADGGFFRIRDACVLDLEFVDVYWTISDLRNTEKVAYQQRGAEIAQQMFSRLKGLQTAQYECPLCHQKSELREYSGHMLATTCPKCQGQFKIENPGDDLALNLYLLSLSGPDRRTA